MNKPENMYIRRFTRNNRMVKAIQYKRDMTDKLLHWHKACAYGGWARRGDIYATQGDIIIVDEGKVMDGEWIVCESGYTKRVTNYEFHEKYTPLLELPKHYVDRLTATAKSGNAFQIGDAGYNHAKE